MCFSGGCPGATRSGGWASSSRGGAYVRIARGQEEGIGDALVGGRGLGRVRGRAGVCRVFGEGQASLLGRARREDAIGAAVGRGWPRIVGDACHLGRRRQERCEAERQ